MKQMLINKNGDSREIKKYFSPGRINLIGEHIDYVGGRVIPAAISAGITAYASKSNDINILSLNYEKYGWINAKVDFNAKYNSNFKFLNFVNGIYKELSSYKKQLNGINIVLNSTLPISSGLSSSASLCVLILTILNDLYNLKLSPIDIVLKLQKVENNFIGVKSGIMDQFIIVNGRKNSFLSLDTASLDFYPIPSQIRGHYFLIINCQKPRELVDSKYNERVEQLNEVTKILKNKNMDIEFQNLSSLYKRPNILAQITDKTLHARFKHIISERNRVDKAEQYLKQGDANNLGKILNESHLSLSKDYEVSCAELDFIHEKLLKFPNIKGSRMIGAGFGGCILALVDDKFQIDQLNLINEKYKQKFNHKFKFLSVNISDGTREIYE